MFERRQFIVAAAILAALLLGLTIATTLRGQGPVAANRLHLHTAHALAQSPPLQANTLLQTAQQLHNPELAAMAAELETAGFCALAGNLYVRAGEPTLAVAALSGCLRQPAAPLFLSYAQAGLGQDEGARAAMAAEPGMVRYLFHAGLAAAERDDGASAAVLMGLALDLDNGRQLSVYERRLLFQHLITISVALDRPQEAIVWAQRWEASDPRDFAASIRLAGLLLNQRDHQAALEVLQRAEARGGRRHQQFAGTLGRVYQAQGQWELAAEEFRNFWLATEQNPTQHAYAAWYLGQALARLGEGEEARYYLDYALAEGPPNIQRLAADLLAGLN